MSKKKINSLIIEIFSLNKKEISALGIKNLNIKDLKNFDSLKFMKFLSTIENTFKIDISENDFDLFFSTNNIYRYFEKLKNKKKI